MEWQENVETNMKASFATYTQDKENSSYFLRQLFVIKRLFRHAANEGTPRGNIAMFWW